MGEHSREVTAVLAEPEDGTRLVVVGERESKVIWRDDAAARASSVYVSGEHWFDDPDDDPMELHEHVKYADVVYQLGPVVANFEHGRGSAEERSDDTSDLGCSE